MLDAKKKAIARYYAGKKKAAARPRMYRTVPQRRQVAPIYKTVPTKPTSSMITGVGKYGLRNAGQDIGRGVGHVLERIFGSGDYSIQANSIMGGIYDPPELHNKSERTVCIRHREYITDIVASTAFSLSSYPINPGLKTSFPWLSQVAEAFEEYRFTGLVYEYKSLSADYTTASSAALGYVIMSTQYNVLNPNFPDKITMENYEFSNDGKPSVSFFHPVECKRALNPVSELFVRTGSPTTGDYRLYDHGNFQIATGGNTGSGVVGELWCTFEIEFYKPKLVGSIGYELLTDHWSATEGITGTLLFGTNPVLLAGSNLGTTLVPADAIINFPDVLQDGYYMVIYTCSGSSDTLLGYGIVTTNCEIVNSWKVDQAVSNINNSGTTADTFIQCFVVRILAINASLDFGGGSTMPSLPTSMDLWVTQINGGLYS